MSLFDFLPDTSFIFNPQHPVPTLELRESQPIKRWNREHKWCWCPACAQRNPRGARERIDIGFRHCGHCAALLWRALDSEALNFPVPDEYPWFMRMNNGPRGTGWYRRKSIEILYGRH